MVKMTEELKSAIVKGKENVVDNSDSFIRIEHIIYGILTTENVISEIVKSKADDFIDLVAQIEDLNASIAVPFADELESTGAYSFDHETKECLRKAEKINKENGGLVTLENFFIVILEQNIGIVDILNEYGINKHYVVRQLDNLSVNASYGASETKKTNMAEKKNAKTPMLDNFGRDLTKLASEGKLDPVIGRESEVERVAQILTRKKKNNPVLIGDPGVGKCLAKGTKVLMYDGTFKNVEDIQVGEQLMGVDSTPRTVLSLGRGESPMYEVNQKKGMRYRVNNAHILSLKTSTNKKEKNGVVKNITIQDFIALPKSKQKQLKGWKTGIDFPEQYVPVDPYYIGLWLGDGSKKNNEVTNIDSEILDYLTNLAKSFGIEMSTFDITHYLKGNRGYRLRQIDSTTDEIVGYVNSITEFAQKAGVSGRSISDCLAGKQKTAYGYKWELISAINPINSILADLGILQNKFIPTQYLINSRDVRLKLLAGLIDSDGYLHNNVYEITQKSKQLCDGIVYLVNSLGYRIQVKEKVVKNAVYYRMTISGNNLTEIPCLLSRKKVMEQKGRTDKQLTGIEVEEIGLGEYFGFTIDGDHLFLLEDFTVTHNTAIAEGLAIRIAKKECPPVLQDKRVISLELTNMVAGTKYRGEFEGRMKSLLEELRDHPEIILFVDELHTMVGAGNGSGALDAANVFKPALARGEVKVIGATTLDEYREHIEKDGALERRFQKVQVNPTNLEETEEILMSIKEKYEEFHNVTYTEEAISLIVRLADRYITTREFPDKAIDILDEAGSRTQISIKKPENIKALERKLDSLKKLKKEVLAQEKFEQAIDIRDEEEDLKDKLSAATKKWKDSMARERVTIDGKMINEVVSVMTGIPITKMSENETQKLMNLESSLGDIVVGQKEAIKIVSSAIKRNRTGIRRKGRPIGTFIFLGPTGVGKTELAKALALEVFGSADAMVRIDMNEFSEKFSVSRLIGAPPGYVGYNEGGQLTEAVRNKPYCVVLLDEAEKAHPAVFDILMQLTDEGYITDGMGRTVNFKNTLIIMTSNAGVRSSIQFGNGIGFSTGQSAEDRQRDIINKEVRKYFKPEFLNRIDDVIIFNNLEENEILQIVDLQLKDLAKRIKEESGHVITFGEGVREFLRTAGYDCDMGARELQRTIQKEVENPISDELLNAGMPENAQILVSMTPDGKKLQVTVNVDTQLQAA